MTSESNPHANKVVCLECGFEYDDLEFRCPRTWNVWYDEDGERMQRPEVECCESTQRMPHKDYIAMLLNQFKRDPDCKHERLRTHHIRRLGLGLSYHAFKVCIDCGKCGPVIVKKAEAMP